MEEESIHIVMEYAEKGDLYKVIIISFIESSFLKNKDQRGSTFQRRICGIFPTKF